MHKNNNKTKLNANESHTSKFLECIISTTTAIATKKSNYDCSLFFAFFLNLTLRVFATFRQLLLQTTITNYEDERIKRPF